MIIKKWNCDTKEYEKHEVSDAWNIKTYAADMEETVNCVCCGKEIRYGDGYTSRRFHADMGMGYAECEDCYFSYRE